jgi:hypothetical protein
MGKRVKWKIKRAKAKKALSNLDYKRLAYDWGNIDWDEGWDSVPYKKKLIWRHQQRKWRTWKYNRKTQYKT